VTTVEMTTTGDAVVRDLPHADYLAHAALSASGAKTLIQPGGPARFHHERTHPRPATDAMNLGTAAHNAVLGTGPELEVIDAPNWQTRAAKEAKEQALTEGKVPLLPKDKETVDAMAVALRRHPIASRLLNPASGEAEVSLFWHDPEHDVDRRCRVDFLRVPDDSGRLILCDYKSAASATPEAITRAVINYSYHLAAAWYQDLVIGLGLARTAPFVLIFQETTAPYLVHCVELDQPTMLMGRELCQRALMLYKSCTETGVWGGYNDEGITLIGAPSWAQARHEQERLTW
jgi:PDDEXK-like domain of unknown function (DUF3799)